MSNFKKIINCRVCQRKDRLKIFLNLKNQPLANNFSRKKVKKYPLILNHCSHCNHNQLSLAIKPSILFNKYLYRSSFSNSYNKHNFNLVRKIIKLFKITPDSIVYDIGSNDGLLLNFFRESNISAIGIEPSKNLSKLANDQDLLTENIFFNYKESKFLEKKYGKADIITANNVFAHIQNFDDFIKGISKLLSENGKFIAEVSYFKDVIKKNLFDTIYHEHIDYHLLTCLEILFKRHNLKLFDCELIDVHGGSIRIYVSKNKLNKTKKLKYLLSLEKKFLKNFNMRLLNFKKNIIQIGTNITNLLENYKKQKFNIICYGASAKATIFINTFNLASFIDKCLDDTKIKQNLYIPGTKIKILNPENYNFLKKDIILISAWNFSEEIIKKIRRKNKRILIIRPLPKLVIIK